MATVVPTGDETLNFEPEETNRGMPMHLDLAIRGGEDELLDDPVRDQAQRSPGTDRRLTPTLLRVFARRRKQIGVSLDQVARLSGISTAELVRYEDEAVPTSITY
ncbi:MAG: helix-turn-helix transcriptional regulator, partial [Polyangia bacterium]